MKGLEQKKKSLFAKRIMAPDGNLFQVVEKNDEFFDKKVEKFVGCFMVKKGSEKDDFLLLLLKDLIQIIYEYWNEPGIYYVLVQSEPGGFFDTIAENMIYRYLGDKTKKREIILWSNENIFLKIKSKEKFVKSSRMILQNHDKLQAATGVIVLNYSEHLIFLQSNNKHLIAKMYRIPKTEGCCAVCPVVRTISLFLLAYGKRHIHIEYIECLDK